MIQTTAEITEAIQGGNIDFTSQMLKHLITEHRGGEGDRIKGLWKRYKLEDPPIKSLPVANYEKVVRRTANDFFADIVDTKAGYMGNQVSVNLNREVYKRGDKIDEERFGRDREKLRLWQIRSYSEDLNSELVLYAAACGIAYRLLYIPQGSMVPMMKNLDPWEVIYIYDQSIDEPQVVIRYYTIKGVEFGPMADYKEYTVAEWYDDTNITYYIDDGKLNFKLDETKGSGGIQPHLFDGIPIIPFENNKLRKAEPEKVLDLIDAYDAIVSSTTSEIEQLRMAYMFLKGAGLLVDDAFMKSLEQTGIFPLEENGEVGFINKQLADAPVHNLLAEIRKNIYQFSKSIDMSKDFGGEMRVIGWQVALLNLENSSKITERKFTRGLINQYRLLSAFWDFEVDPYKLEFVFTRNFPRDIKAEAETLQLLLNSVSTETAFSLMSFIDDAEIEKRKIEEEQGPYRGIDGDSGLENEQPESIPESGSDIRDDT